MLFYYHQTGLYGSIQENTVKHHYTKHSTAKSLLPLQTKMCSNYFKHLHLFSDHSVNFVTFNVL